jgi:hypothetical protein
MISISSLWSAFAIINWLEFTYLRFRVADAHTAECSLFPRALCKFQTALTGQVVLFRDGHGCGKEILIAVKHPSELVEAVRRVNRSTGGNGTETDEEI